MADTNISENTDRQKVEELLKDPTANLTLQVASINGVIGILGVTQMFGGNVVSAEFKPLTKELAKKMKIAADFGELLKTQNAKAQDLVKSGKLKDLEWLKEHIAIDNKNSPQKSKFFEIFDEMRQYDPDGLARAFTKDKNLIVGFAPLKDKFAEVFKDINYVVFDEQTYGVSEEWMDAFQNRNTTWHELDHLKNMSPPDLNARQSALVGGVVDEVSAHWASRRRLWMQYRDYVKIASEEKATKVFEALDIPEKYHQILLSMRRMNDEAFDAVYYGVCGNVVAEKYWVEDIKKQLMNEDYKTQMLAHALSADDMTGHGNLEVVKMYVDDILQRHGLDEKARAKIWQEVEPYANGHKDLPLLRNIVRTDGTLAEMPKEIIKYCQSNEDACKYLAKNWNDTDAILTYFSQKLDGGWQRRCPQEFIERVQKAGYEFLPTDVQLRLNNKVGFNGDRFDSTTGEELIPEAIFTNEEKMAMRSGIVKKQKLKDIESGIARKVADFKAGKIVVRPDGKVEKPVGNPSGPSHAENKPSNKHTMAYEFGKAAKSLAANWALMTAAYQGGRVWRNQFAANGRKVLHIDEREKNVAIAKAQAFLTASGVAAAGAGVGITVFAKKLPQRLVKGAGRSMPFVGAAINAGCAYTRAQKGDWTGVGLELTSAALDIASGVAYAAAAGSVASGAGAPASVPLAAIGTKCMYASTAMNVFIAARDGALVTGVEYSAMLDEHGHQMMTTDEHGKKVPKIGAAITYERGIRQGEATWFGVDRNGKDYIAQYGRFKDDAKTGEWLTFAENGCCIEQAHYDKGRLVGEYLRTDSNGKTIMESNDMMNGTIREYWTDENGNATDVLKWEGMLKNGKFTGIRTFYDRYGRPEGVIDYETGEYLYARLDQRAEIILDQDGVPLVEEGRLPNYEVDRGPVVETKPVLKTITKQEKSQSKWTKPAETDPKPTKTEPQTSTPPSGKTVETKPEPQTSTPPSGKTVETKTESQTSTPPSGKTVETKPEPQVHTPERQQPLLGEPLETKPRPSLVNVPPADTTTVVTPDGNVWEMQGGKPVKVGHANTMDGVHIVYDGDYHPENPHGTNVAMQTKSGGYTEVSNWSASNESGSFSQEVSRTDNPEVRLTPYAGQTVGTKPPANRTEPAKPAEGKQQATGTKPPANRTEPAKPAEVKQQATGTKPPANRTEPAKPAEGKQQATGTKPPANRTEPAKPAEGKQQSSTPAQTEKTKSTSARMDHETGKKKMPLKTPSAAGKADPRKNKRQLGNGKGLDDQLKSAEQSNSRPETSKPEKTVATATVEAAKVIAESTPTGVLIKTGVGVAKFLGKKMKEFQK